MQYCCEPNPFGVDDVTCLNCEAPFVPGTAIIGVRAGGELIGVVCPDCLAPDARQRLDEKARVFFDQGLSGQ